MVNQRKPNKNLRKSNNLLADTVGESFTHGTSTHLTRWPGSGAFRAYLNLLASKRKKRTALLNRISRF